MNRSHALFIMLIVVTSTFGLGLIALPVNVQAQEPLPQGKVVYFHNATNANGDTLMNTSRPTGSLFQEINFTDALLSFNFFIDPVLAGSMRMNGSFLVLLWVKQVSAPGATNFIDFSFDIHEVDAAGNRLALLVDSPETSYLDITTHYSEYAFGATISSTVTAGAGRGLELVVTMESNGANMKFVAWGSQEFPSRAVIGAVDRINVASVSLLNSTGGQPPYFEQTDVIRINATVTDPFGGYDILWANATLVAPDGSFVFQHVPMALTSGNDTSFAKTFELEYDDPSKLRGIYSLTIEAVDRTGYHFRFPDRPGDETFGGHLETETVLFAVGEVLYANFRVLDGDGDLLGGAILRVRQNTATVASLLTDPQGRANATLPGAGDYTAEVSWQDTFVLSQPLTISANVPESDPIELTAGVYSPTFRIVDVGFVPLGDATVFVSHPNGSTLFRPLTTDANGDIRLTRTAQGTYGLLVLWRGIEVADASVGVSASTTYSVVANVFYLTLTALDADGIAVPGVHVIFQDSTRGFVVDSRSTDATGQTVSRLPSGTYALEATWFGVNVANMTGVTLPANRTLDLPLSIFSVRLTAVDERDIPLEAATIAIEIAAFQVSGVTDSQGQMTFKLPGGNLAMRVWWRDVLVFEGVESVSANRTDVALTTAVHYVAFRTVDRDGAPIPGVAVTLFADDVSMDGGLTDANGTVEFRQPVGTYRVVARLETTHLLTPVDMTISQAVSFPTAAQPVELRFSEFAPSFTSTVLFPVVLLLLALVAAAFVLWWKLLRGRKAAGGPEAPSPETPKEEP